MLVWIKKIFNRFFSEEFKVKIRNKFEKCFIYFDQRLIYKEYLKASRYILKQKIYGYQGEGYDYRYDNFLESIKKEYIRSGIISGHMSVRDKEMEQAIEYVKENGLDVYCGSLDGIHIYDEGSVGYDEAYMLYYGIYEGKRLYFERKIATNEDALNALNGLAAEQSEHSPHRYLTEEFSVDSNDIVFDVGCADGNFALSVVDRVKEIYLFEIEESWMKPLELTFAPYKDKVHIIQKCVTKSSDAAAVSIDDFCEQNNIESIGLVKLDVEGYEKDVLSGAHKMLTNNKIKRLAVCTYHKPDDEQTLGAMLPNYHKVMSEGYMLSALIQDIWNIKPPYFAKGLMRATLKCIE